MYNKALGEIPITQDAITTIENFLVEHPEFNEHKNLVIDAYRAGTDLAGVTAKLIHNLFGSYGLLIFNPDSTRIKSFSRDFIYKCFSAADELSSLLLKRTELFI